MDVDRDSITEDIRQRDVQDSTRSIAPLKRADDARYVDSSAMTIESVVEVMLSHISTKERQ